MKTMKVGLVSLFISMGAHAALMPEAVFIVASSAPPMAVLVPSANFSITVLPAKMKTVAMPTSSAPSTAQMAAMALVCCTTGAALPITAGIFGRKKPIPSFSRASPSQPPPLTDETSRRRTEISLRELITSKSIAGCATARRRTTQRISCQVCTGSPPTLSTRSPFSKPAAAAGLARDGVPRMGLGSSVPYKKSPQ